MQKFYKKYFKFRKENKMMRVSCSLEKVKTKITLLVIGSLIETAGLQTDHIHNLQQKTW